MDKSIVLLNDNSRTSLNKVATTCNITSLINDLIILSSTPIKELLHGDLLIYPKAWGCLDSDIADSTILTLYKDGKVAAAGDKISNSGDGYTIQTNNIMGFFSVGSTQIQITSRFTSNAKNDNIDYFLHYMLQRVNRLNITSLDTKSNDESIFDLLAYLFPAFLKNALTQGVYKEYKTLYHNDSNIRGTIQIARHVRCNTPFIGKVAYNNREYSFDNHVTQLVHHAIEYIKKSPYIKNILYNNSDTKENVATILQCTKSFNAHELRKTLLRSTRPLYHPYFNKWKELQVLSRAILTHKKIAFGYNDKAIQGILFDGATLWEEYLATFLTPKGFIHPNNRKSEGGLYLFYDTDCNKSVQKIYPDFYKDDVLIDAKYTALDKYSDYNSNDRRLTDIYYKTLTYMMRLNIKKGVLLYPSNISIQKKEYKIIDSCYTLYKVPFAIPKSANSWSDFCEKMKTSQDNCIELV